MPAACGVLSLQFEAAGPLIRRRLKDDRIGGLLSVEIHLYELSGLRRLAGYPERRQRIVEGILYGPRVRLRRQPPVRRAREFAITAIDAKFMDAPRVVAATSLHHTQRTQRLERKSETQPPGGRIFRSDGRPQN